jgi:hypothetical protein
MFYALITGTAEVIKYKKFFLSTAAVTAYGIHVSTCNCMSWAPSHFPFVRVQSNILLLFCTVFIFLVML